MSKFTKGPWVKNGLNYYGSDGDTVVVSDGPAFGSKSTWKNAEANTNLILAAPDMYVALMDARSALRYIRESHGDLYGVGFDRVEKKSTAALAKADGKGKGKGNE